MNNNIGFYASNEKFKIIKKILNGWNVNIIDNSLVNIGEILAKSNILIIEEENQEIFSIIKKLKIIVFTNISKYIDSLDYIYYQNPNILNEYLKLYNANINKTFGIIIPVYNTYKYLSKCVDSVLTQSFNNYKIYICDDYSNIDDYNNLKKKYLGIKNIFVFRNSKNLGKFLSINMILDKINTDYFLVLDSDDKLTKNRLLYDLIYLNTDNDKIYGVQSKYVRFDKPKVNIIENDYGHNSITFKKSIIKKIGYYCPNRFGSDTEYIMRIKKMIGNNSIIRYDKITYIAITRCDDTNLTKIYNVEQRRIFINKIIDIYANITNYNNLFNKKTDYFVDLVNYSKSDNLVLEDYKKFYLDISHLNENELLKHWESVGNIEGRLPNINLFYYHYPNFNFKLFKTNTKCECFVDKYKIFGWVFLKNKKNYINWLNNYIISNKFFNTNGINEIDGINKITNGDKINFENFIAENKIKYINVSKALEHFELRICSKFNLIKYNKLCDKFENVVFFGLYDKDDYLDLLNHIGKKYLIWGGTDANVKFKHRADIVNKIKNYYDINNLSISIDIYNSLSKYGISSILIYLNLVDYNIFKPIDKFGKSIYVYNGFTKGNEEIYGKSIYQEVIKKIPEYNFIFSNELGIPYKQMPKIYSKCFIGLRLTEHDGNANTVQEFNAMGIPIIFNGDGGIGYTNVEDIIQIIKKFN